MTDAKTPGRFAVPGLLARSGRTAVGVGADVGAPGDANGMRFLRRSTSDPVSIASKAAAPPDRTVSMALRRSPISVPPRAARQPVGIIRRALKADQVIPAVDKIDFLKNALDRGTDAQKRGSTTETMRERLQKFLDENSAMFGDDDAMSIALAIDAVAKVIASELYDDALKPAIAKHLMDVFAPQLEGELSGDGKDKKAALGTAKTIVSVDALSLYMHHERTCDDAAWDIKDAAADGKMKPADLYQLLLKKFQSELGSYTAAYILKQQDTGVNGVYVRKEATGELSVEYLEELFGENLDTAADSTKKVPHAANGKKLEFTPQAKQRLDALRDAVDQAADDRLADPRPKDAASRRNRYLHDVSEKDKAIKGGRDAAVLAKLQKSPWNLSAAKAAKVIAEVKAKLPGLPLTITHWVDSRTADGPGSTPFSAVDVSRAGQRTDTDVQGKTFSAMGEYTHPTYKDERGAHYTQFRGWKDRLMTGNLGMDGAEMPVFGAVNVNFRRGKGTERTRLVNGAAGLETRDKLNSKEKKTLKEQQKADRDTFGTNYYGDMHLVLKRSQVVGRTVYTAGDHGQPHLDPFLAFADFVAGSSAADNYRSDLTGLKGTVGTMSTEYAQAIVGSLLGSKKAAQMNLPFEIQIHGGVDWSTDVEEIWIAPSAPAAAVKRLETWARGAPGRPKIRKIKPPKTGTITSKKELARSGVKHANKL